MLDRYKSNAQLGIAVKTAFPDGARFFNARESWTELVNFEGISKGVQ